MRTERTSRVGKLDEAVGRILKQQRIASKISLESVGKAVGVAWQQISKYEKGVNSLSVTRLTAAANALGTTASEIVLMAENECFATDHKLSEAANSFYQTRNGADIMQACSRLSAKSQKAILQNARQFADIERFNAAVAGE